MSTHTQAAVDGILASAINARVFPGAVVEVGRAEGSLFTRTAGSLTYEPEAAPVGAHTIYDLASLTKVIGAAALMAGQIQSGRMRLNDRVRHWIACWTGEERQVVTLQDLLEHCSGLPGHRRYFESRHGRDAFEMAICEEPLEYVPRSASIYSDPGFMLLGFAMENAAGAPLDRQFDEWRDAELGRDVELRYRPGAEWLERIAPTENTPFGEVRRGAGARRERGGARRCRHTCGTVRHRSSGRRLRPMVDALTVAAAVRGEDRCSEQFARSRLGHDAADVILRHEAVARGDRSHRLYRDVAVARSRAGSVCGGLVQPRASDARGRWNSGREARVTRRDRYRPPGGRWPGAVMFGVGDG